MRVTGTLTDRASGVAFALMGSWLKLHSGIIPMGNAFIGQSAQFKRSVAAVYDRRIRKTSVVIERRYSYSE